MNMRNSYGVMALTLSLHVATASASDALYCDSFESCPTADTETIQQLEARVAELERLLSGAERSLNSSTGKDTLMLQNALSSDALRVAELLTTQDVGNSPICFNLEGHLLPCPGDYAPPPEDSLIGRWTGIKQPDPGNSETYPCFEDEVSFDLAIVSGDVRLNNITTRRSGVGLDFSTVTNPIIRSGFLSDRYFAFDRKVSFSIQFDSFGIAQGEWTEQDFGFEPAPGSCYGTFELNRE